MGSLNTTKRPLFVVRIPFFLGGTMDLTFVEKPFLQVRAVSTIYPFCQIIQKLFLAT